MVGVEVGEEMVTVGDVLSAAADRIEKYGWVKNQFGDAGGPVCAWGAMNLTAKHHPGSATDATFAVREAFGDFLGVPTARWNDNIAKSKRQVVKTLRLAAWVYEDTLLPEPVIRRG